MPGQTNQGPMCQVERPICIDEGTLFRGASPLQTPLGSYQSRAESLEASLKLMESEALNFGYRFISDSNVRQNYFRAIQNYSQEILKSVRQGGIRAEEGARLAHAMRNEIMEFSRLKSSDIGRAVAQRIKSNGLRLDELTEAWSQKLFKKAFANLAETEKNQVYLQIIESSGRARSSVTSNVMRLSKIGRGLLLLTAGVVVYNVVTAEDKVEASVREGVGLGGGIAGGALGGGIAGLACGPGAPVCVTVGVFIGGALGALGIDLLFDWVKDRHNPAL